MKSNNKKNIIAIAVLCATTCAICETQQPQVFPIGIGITDQAEFPVAEADSMGGRLCLVYGRHANVAGLDIGVIGCVVDGSLFGLQTSVLLNNVGSANGAGQIAGIANNCYEDFYGFQVAGIANNTQGCVHGGQIASFNMAKELKGTQIAVFNKAEKAVGIQIGVINWATEMKGIQLGVLNIIENSQCPYLPLINANF